MFQVDFSTVIFMYVFIPLFFLLVSWAYYELIYKVSKFKHQQKHVFQCTICTYSYIISPNIFISKCPRCGSMNDVTY